jgi:hypothetical protein
MKKLFCLAMIGMLGAGTLAAPLCGDLEGRTLDEVLAKYYEARGGLAKLKALNGWKMTGKIDLPGAGREMAMALWQLRPGKLRVEWIFQGQKIVQACDGRTAWWIVPFVSETAREMPADQAGPFREQAEFADPLVFFRKQGQPLELLGEETLDDKPVLRLRLTRSDGRVVEYFLAAEDGLLLKTSRSLATAEGEERLEVLYGDYRRVDGLLLPFVVENRRNGDVLARMTFAAIELDPVIDDAFFTMAAKKEVLDKVDTPAKKKAPGKKGVT